MKFFERLRKFKEDGGGHFEVAVYDDFVIKYPKERHEHKLEKMARIQTALSKEIKEIMPCYKIGKYLFTKKAPGVRCDKTNKVSEEEFDKFAREMEAMIMGYGYMLPDITPKNVFYEDGNYYIIDFSLVDELDK